MAAALPEPAFFLLILLHGESRCAPPPGGVRRLSLLPGQPRRARPVDEAAKARLAAQPSRVQRTKQARRSRGSGLSFARARRRPKQKQGTATRSSAPVFASAHRGAPQKSAKRKRGQGEGFLTCAAGRNGSPPGACRKSGTLTQKRGPLTGPPLPRLG